MSTSQSETLGSGNVPAPVKPLHMLTKINTHKADDQELIEIVVMDEPGPGGAHHDYLAFWPSPRGVQSARIQFQHGPILEHGVNGLTQEVLLAIVAHRLECFQKGPFPSEHNKQALKYVWFALQELKDRTAERKARGVEGKTQA